MTISMDFSCGDGLDRKENQVSKRDEKRETSGSGATGRSHGMEIDDEFTPIEHPQEPPDEDRPLKCPMPNSSVVNKDGGMRNERSAESIRKKRVEVPVANEEGLVNPRPPAVRKRHHALTPDYAAPRLLRASQSSTHLTNASEM